MTRSIYTLGLGAALLFACNDSNHPVSPQGTITGPSATRTASATQASGNIVTFETMYGVAEAFIDNSSIRGVKGDELPWAIGSATGSLSVDGHLIATIRGLVFADDPSVPPPLRGINDESEFRALVSCLVSESPGKGNGKPKVQTVNILTGGFPAGVKGNSNIDAQLDLPDDCVAPIIFIMSGSEDKWFSVMGAETSEE
jgi:hypothetical protein